MNAEVFPPSFHSKPEPHVRASGLWMCVRVSGTSSKRDLYITHTAT